jgi:hypothetical protein
MDITCSWSLLPTQEDSVTTTFFGASMIAIFGNENMLKFWQDPWLDDQSITKIAPELAEVVPRWCRKERLVASALHNNN